MIRLYDYFRSSASYRVRIALNLKKISHHTIPIHLVKDGGEQHHPDYQAKNPQSLVPTLEIENNVITQSLAILEYLEEKYPHPPLLPEDAFERAKARQLAMLVACDIHPINNLRVLQYLTNTLRHDEVEKKTWYQHWVQLGFQAFEEWLKRYQSNGKFCLSEHPTFADVCLIPQVYNALRFECSLEKFPLIKSIYAHCETLPAFQQAAPQENSYS